MYMTEQTHLFSVCLIVPLSTSSIGYFLVINLKIFGRCFCLSILRLSRRYHSADQCPLVMVVCSISSYGTTAARHLNKHTPSWNCCINVKEETIVMFYTFMHCQS